MKKSLQSLIVLLMALIMSVTATSAQVKLTDGVYQDGSTLYISSGVTSLGPLQVNPSVIYSFAATPPACVEITFTGYEATLHMPATSYGAYFVANYWGNFVNMYNDAVEPTGVTVSKANAEILVGNTMTLNAVVAPNNASLRTVLWTSTDSQVATVSSGGIVTALATGECDIVASCLDKQAVCHVTVYNPISVALDQTSLTIEQTQQVTLTATVSPEGATGQSVTWATTDPSVATVNGGVVTGVGIGECDIIASYLDKQAVCHVTVYNPISVALDQTSVTIEQTQQVTLTATLSPEGTTGQSVTWATTDPSVATVNGGVVTGVGIGECDIIASYLDKQAVCHVTVVAATIYITLDKHEAKLLPNHALTITPTMSPLSTELKVTVSNPEVAAARLVNGVVQVVGLTEGSTMIVVSSTDGHAVPDACMVTVYTQCGDVNCDGYVTIGDVTALIDYLLGGEVGTFSATNADTNRNGSVSIADVTTLIDYLLGGIDLNPPVTETFTVNGVTFTMVAVEGGTFTMGATEEQGSDAHSLEYPAHQVTLSDYCIGQTEVTQALWQAVMGSNPSEFKGDLNRPVETVSWYDCQTFITKLNELTGKTFRLPTEAEWEFAARGGNRNKGYKYSGSNTIGDVAWFYDNSGSTTHPVATKAPNELGLYDMSGNVWEWCQDWYGSYSSESQTNPTGPATGSIRVLRGGSWDFKAWGCRVSFRSCYDPSYAGFIRGLRLAL